MSFSTCVIDGVYGRPAEGVPIRLYGMSEDHWRELGRGRTDSDGRISSLLDTSSGWALVRLELDLDAYFSTLGITSCYPVITITMRIADASDSHLVSLLITPSSYVTFQVS